MAIKLSNLIESLTLITTLKAWPLLIDDLLAREHLSQYHLAHSARADMCRRLGRIPEAVLRMRRLLPWRPRHRPAVFSPGGLQN